jgi:amino acid transporter
MLIAVTLSIGDLPGALDAKNPFIFVLRGALGSTPGNALVSVAMAAMWFCGLSSVTSNSRMLFAFARDGGLPFAKQLARVSPRFRSPQVAVWTSAAMALLVALWADAYSAMVALSVVALYASYGLPVLLGLRAQSRARGPWTLGRYSRLVNLVALAWIAVCLVLFVLPPNQLAGYTFAGCLAALHLYWRFRMRDRFAGPPVLRKPSAW